MSDAIRIRSADPANRLQPPARAGALLGDGMTDSKPGSVGWSYGGVTGPRRWSSLSDSFTLCRYGIRQSPIDITGYETASGESIRCFYDSRPVEVHNNGRTITIWYEPGSSMVVGRNTFQLVQAHYHAPSEHLIDGRQFAAEIHLLHENDQGELAVVARLLELGEPSGVIGNLLIYADPEEAPDRAHTSLNSRVLRITGVGGYYYYVGSTTTPPCLEPVRWFVMAQPDTVSHDQVEAMNLATRGPNNREIQPLNGRTITRVV